MFCIKTFSSENHAIHSTVLKMQWQERRKNDHVILICCVITYNNMGSGISHSCVGVGSAPCAV